MILSLAVGILVFCTTQAEELLRSGRGGREPASDTKDRELRKLIEGSVGHWLSPAERVRKIPGEVTFFDTRAIATNWTGLSKGPCVLTFMYTRCTSKQKCLRTMTQVVELEKLIQQSDIKDKARIVVMTYDVRNDSVEVLKELGERRGIDGKGIVSMVTCSEADWKRMDQALGIRVAKDDNGVKYHVLQLFVVDGKGRCAREYHSIMWEPGEVLSDLKALVEGRPTRVPPQRSGI